MKNANVEKRTEHEWKKKENEQKQEAAARCK